MITVTEPAKVVLKELLDAHSNDPEMGLRIVMGPEEKVGLVLGAGEPDDQVVEHEGTKLLFVSPELAPMFDKITLDVENVDDAPKLIIKNDAADK